ncbi:MAG: hypothetical protein M1606_02195 [Candidatus Thermoplasmatota archaeon]|jgi:hypothetical protein|nr:hypothetical protein [Candidatus Thermoplasmatota archaeon]MCL5983461.1 hypothetical protein [Candidatus Thermoplasmatota archaeon]
MSDNGEWLRGRGIGRERFATYLGDYLATLGFEVQKTEFAEPTHTVLSARLTRMNPSVPASAKELSFELFPSSGGATLYWKGPAQIDAKEAGRMDRFVREISTHLERVIATESHLASRVIRPPVVRLPWEPAPSAAPS